MPDGACLVYVTAGSEDEALAIARAVVGEGLAACANILGAMRSVFFWEGAVRDEGEIALLLKTSDAMRRRLVDRVAALHSYDCPCVVCLPIVDGHAPFLDWIGREVGGSRTHDGDA